MPFILISMLVLPSYHITKNKVLLLVKFGTCYHLRLTNVIHTSKLRLNLSSEISLNFIYMIRERKIHWKNTCVNLAVVFLARNSVTSVSVLRLSECSLQWSRAAALRKAPTRAYLIISKFRNVHSVQILLKPPRSVYPQLLFSLLHPSCWTRVKIQAPL